MDARLDTLSTELYQVNIHVGRIAWRQVVMGGFAPEASSPPPPMAFDFEDKDDDNGNDNDALDDDDGDASSIDEMSTWHSYLLGSKDLGFMYLESYFVLLANHDQNNVFKLF